MPDVNYTVVFSSVSFSNTGSPLHNAAIQGSASAGATNKTTSVVQIMTGDTNTNNLRDLAEISAVVFR